MNIFKKGGERNDKESVSEQGSEGQRFLLVLFNQCFNVSNKYAQVNERKI